jgi:hypothetical protein
MIQFVNNFLKIKIAFMVRHEIFLYCFFKLSVTLHNIYVGGGFVERKISIITSLVETFIYIQSKVYKIDYKVEFDGNSIQLMLQQTPILNITWNDDCIKLSLGTPWANKILSTAEKCIPDNNKLSPYYYHTVFSDIDEFGFFFAEKVM